MQKFFLYARKSTDVEDKQVLSIEAQLTELREYAKRENIIISAEVVEKQSAKYIGRPLFNKMLDEIEKFDAETFSHGILIVSPAIRWTEVALFISSTLENLRA
jgi:DNA invertase Pin-like site-specific DNA recombinase